MQNINILTYKNKYEKRDVQNVSDSGTFLFSCALITTS